MLKDSRLVLAESFNGTMLSDFMTNDENLKTAVQAEVEDFFAVGGSVNHYDKEAVMDDLAACTTKELRREFSRMGFAMRLTDDHYAIINNDDWKAYIDNVMNEDGGNPTASVVGDSASVE